jgi:hypothetical protein
MKSTFICSLLVLALLLGFTEQTQAGHNESKRNGCWFLNKRFKIDAHVTLGFLTPLCIRRGGDCDFLEGSCNNFGSCNAYSWSKAGWGFVGGGHRSCGIYHAGITPALIPQLYSNMPWGDEAEHSESNAVDPQFEKNLVLLNRLSITLTSSANSDWVNEYRVTVWAPEDDEEAGIEDDEITAEKTIASSRIYIKNGEVVVTGGILTKDDFEIKRSGDIVTVTYKGGDKKVSIPESYDGKVLAVTTGGDAQPDFEGLVSKKADELSTSPLAVKTTVYPNPSENSIMLTLVTEKEQKMKYTVYDAMGKLVIPGGEEKVKGTKVVTIDISKLSKGSYYVLVSDGRQKTLKKFIKQ